MVVHTFDQAIQARNFVVVVKDDHVPPIPAVFVLSKEPLLHEDVAVHPKIARLFKSPVFPSISVELVIGRVTLCLR